MPTYVYECSRCEQQFEAQQRITEDPLDTCICGSKGTIKRVIQPIAVVFKGSGFHINDYSASGEKPSSKDSDAAPSSSSASPSTDATASTKSESAAPPAAESKSAEAPSATSAAAPSSES